MEIWKDIKGYEGLYQISNLGNVKSLKNKIYLKPSIHKKGYLHCGLSKKGKRKQCFIHRLVAETFIDNPYKLPCVNHKDCNPKNNKIENLEWCTYKDNNNYKNHELKRKISLVIYHLEKEYSNEKQLIESLKIFKRKL